jgi:DeoR family suf operon transcriptional repressor
MLGAFMQPTRQEILDHLRREGQATVKELGELLELTSTGIRQHLTVLERDGLVEAREERGRVGRPALVYRLTEQGDALYPKKYDALANLLLEEARAVMGSHGLHTLLRRAAIRSAAPYLERLEGRPLEERIREANLIMDERGCLSEFAQDGTDWLIHQYSCPFPNVARRNSAVCILEVEFVRQLVGADARLVSSLLRGDRSCTYRVRKITPI